MKNIHHWIFTLKTFRHSYKHTKASTQSYSLLQYTQCLCTGSNSGAQCIHSNLLSVVGVMQGPFYLWRLTHLETRQDWCYVLLYYEINKKQKNRKHLTSWACIQNASSDVKRPKRTHHDHLNLRVTQLWQILHWSRLVVTQMWVCWRTPNFFLWVQSLELIFQLTEKVWQITVTDSGIIPLFVQHC